MKILTYRKDWEEEILIAEEELDEDGNILYSKAIHSGLMEEIRNEYDEEGVLIKESTYHDGALLQVIEFEYFDDDRGSEVRTYQSGELYERVVQENFSYGFERHTYQDGELAEKVVREIDGKEYKDTFYEGNERTQVHVYTYDESKREGRLKYFLADGSLIGHQVEEFDEFDRLVDLKDYQQEDFLYQHKVYTYRGELILSEKVKDLENGIEQETRYTYDEKNRLTKEETYTLTGQLIEFNHYQYDQEDRCIAERQFSLGNSDPWSGGGPDSADIHLIHRYE